MFSRLRTRLALIFGLIAFFAALIAGQLAAWITQSPLLPILLQITLPVAIVAVISAVIAAFKIGNDIADPVQKITESLKKISTGQEGRTVRASTGDELAELIEAHNNMAVSLKRSFSNIYGNEKALSTILDNTADGIVVVDNNRRVVLINNSASTLFGVNRKDATGRHFIEVSMDHEILGMVNVCLAHGEPKYTEVQISPGKKSLGVKVKAMPDNSGCLILLQDLSELQRSRTTRRDFITNISHELRTPVTSIKVLAETLSQGAAKDESMFADYLKKIEQEADRLAHLIAEMSEMLKIEGGYSPVKKTVFPVIDLVQDVVTRFGPQASRSGLTLTIEIPEKLPSVNADRDKLEHVMMNLVQNSIKFTAAGGKITIAATEKAGTIQFSVTDTGTGIPSDDLSRIFERFYKVDRARSGGGTGLGLAIARQIVETHGGRIWAESIEGKGSTFRFTIPL
jgi:two-component system, OmpR family, phosphate regulon sensor histidine kinase PhoR